MQSSDFDLRPASAGWCTMQCIMCFASAASTEGQALTTAGEYVQQPCPALIFTVIISKVNTHSSQVLKHVSSRAHSSQAEAQLLQRYLPGLSFGCTGNMLSSLLSRACLVMPCCDVLCYAIPSHAVLCCAMPYYAMPCHALTLLHRSTKTAAQQCAV